MNKPEEAMPELVEWELLTKAWLKVKVAMIEGENELDAQVMSYLSNKGARPSQSLIDQIDQLRHEEYEARGRMDHFIVELP